MGVLSGLSRRVHLIVTSLSIVHIGAMTLVVMALTFADLTVQNKIRSVGDGVYGDLQAERGKATYVVRCAACHGDDLGGGPFGDGTAPALKRDEFMAGRSLKDIFDRLKRSMPFDAPGSLTNDAYMDTIAYLLRENGYPAGRQELTSNADILAGIIVPLQR